MRILIIILFLSLFFSQEIISLGEPVLKDPIPLISGLYLNDLGSLLPIISFFLNNKKMKKHNIVLIFAIFFIYGLIRYLIYKFEASNIGIEIRIYLSVLTGYFFVLMLKNNAEIKLGISIILYFCFSTIILNFLKLPNLYLFESTRIGSEGIYNLIGPILLIGPTAILILKNSLSGFFFNIVYLVLLIISIILLKTRSLTIIILISIFLIWFVNSRLSKTINKKFKIFLILLSIAVISKITNLEIFELFFSRLSSAKDPENDTNIQFRILEVITIIESNNYSKLLFGAGLAPKAIFLAENGNQYNISHIGISNFFWRFGIIPTLMFSVYLSRKIYYNLKNNNKNTFLILPSFITYLFSSISSGGYGIIPFFCLGILLGIHKKYNLENL